VKVLGIVPARAGSKRVPRKNLAEVGGKPLALRAIETACAARTLARVCVSSDDDDVLALAERARVRAIRRPAEIAGDDAPVVSYLQHALRVMSDGGERFDAIAIVQPTSPFTRADDVDACVRLLEESGADSVVTVVKLDHALQPVKIKRLVGDKLVPHFEDERGRMASFELPELYVRNGSVYVSRAVVVDGGRVLGDDCRAIVMPRERSIDINDTLDLEFARFLCARATGAGSAA
jgi:CMP-N-acetylneuraminic acid synthetase